MTRTNINKYPQHRRADFFEEIQQAMPDIIRLADVPREIIISKCHISEKTYYRKLAEQKYTAKDIKNFMIAIIKYKNATIKKLQKNATTKHTRKSV